jgi:hypothetical protein
MSRELTWGIYKGAWLGKEGSQPFLWPPCSCVLRERLKQLHAKHHPRG